MAEVVLLAAAETDVLEIYARYEDLRESRGDLFSADLDHVLDLLTKFPSLAPMFSEPFRRIRLSRQPFAAFYEVAGNRVIIHAIRSDRESNDYIHRRLGV